MKTLFVVTHTQSIHHTEKRVGGWYDTGLTPRGQTDAEATAERLATLAGDDDVEIFSSDLLRASQTAAIIAGRLNRPIVEMSDLREMSRGSAGGKPQEWLHEREIPPSDDNRMDHRGGIEDAETRREIATRIYRCLDEIVSRACGTQIIVTHGVALTFVIAAWIKMPIPRVTCFFTPDRGASRTCARMISGRTVRSSVWPIFPI